MKKFLFLTLLFAAIMSTGAYAQTADRASMLQQSKDRFKPQMIEKTGLTEAQVDKVLEINLDIRMEAANTLPGLSETDRSKKIAEFKVAKEKRYSEIPLTAEQIRSVYAFFEGMGKNTPPKGGK